MRARDVIGPIVLVGAAVGIRFAVADSGAEADLPRSVTTIESTGSTSSTIPTPEFNDREFTVGECLNWVLGEARVALAPVDCAEPHLAEVAGEAEHPASSGDPFPDATAWHDFIIRECPPVIAAYLGRHLPEDQSFVIDAFRPSPEGWQAARRRVVCTIIAAPSGIGEYVPLEGRVIDLLEQGT